MNNRIDRIQNIQRSKLFTSPQTLEDKEQSLKPRLWSKHSKPKASSVSLPESLTAKHVREILGDPLPLPYLDPNYEHHKMEADVKVPEKRHRISQDRVNQILENTRVSGRSSSADESIGIDGTRCAKMEKDISENPKHDGIYMPAISTPRTSKVFFQREEPLVNEEDQSLHNSNTNVLGMEDSIDYTDMIEQAKREVLQTLESQDPPRFYTRILSSPFTTLFLVFLLLYIMYYI